MKLTAKENIRRSISDAQLKSELKKLFSKGITQKSNAYELLRTKFKLTKQTFLKKFDEVHSAWAKLKDKAENEGMSEAVKEATKNGLKSKFERLMILQNEVDKCLLDLYPLKGKKPTTIEKVSLRKTIKELQSEISKIEGDYAPEKSEVKISQPFNDSQVEKILHEIKRSRK